MTVPGNEDVALSLLFASPVTVTLTMRFVSSVTMVRVVPDDTDSEAMASPRYTNVVVVATRPVVSISPFRGLAVIDVVNMLELGCQGDTR